MEQVPVSWFDKIKSEFGDDPKFRKLVDNDQFFGNITFNQQGRHIVSCNIYQTLLSKTEKQRKARLKDESQDSTDNPSF